MKGSAHMDGEKERELALFYDENGFLFKIKLGQDVYFTNKTSLPKEIDNIIGLSAYHISQYMGQYLYYKHVKLYLDRKYRKNIPKNVTFFDKKEKDE
jgi:hypothetical protein